MVEENPDWDPENWADEAPPDSNLALSLQGIDYPFAHAVADVVDNSISHGKAENVWIEVSAYRGDNFAPYVAIIDDGEGMSPEELYQAITYGIFKEYDEMSLGKFGLGMKTASLSQSEVLTVCSRTDADSDFHCLTWDMNFFRSRKAGGRWIPLKTSIANIPEEVLDYISEGTGTIVFWSDLNKMIPGIYEKNEGVVSQQLEARIRKADSHLGMVFHRFIEGNTAHYGDYKLNLLINDWPVQSWDPFAKWHQASRHHPLDDQGLNMEHEVQDDHPGRISLSFYGKTMSFQARILPKKEEFFDQEVNGVAMNKGQVHNLVGKNRWNDMQGVYFYRMDRIIQAGRWSSILSTDEHCKLARISIDVDRSWDDELQLSINKTYVRLPPDLTGTKEKMGDIRKIFANLRGKAREVYDGPPTITPPGGFPNGGGGGPAPPAPQPAPAPAPPPIPPPPAPAPSIKQTIRLELIKELLESCQDDSEKEMLKELFGRIGEDVD